LKKSEDAEDEEDPFSLLEPVFSKLGSRALEKGIAPTARFRRPPNHLLTGNRRYNPKEGRISNCVIALDKDGEWVAQRVPGMSE
jgi:hypothetical protein